MQVVSFQEQCTAASATIKFLNRLANTGTQMSMHFAIEVHPLLVSRYFFAFSSSSFSFASQPMLYSHESVNAIHCQIFLACCIVEVLSCL